MKIFIFIFLVKFQILYLIYPVKVWLVHWTSKKKHTKCKHGGPLGQHLECVAWKWGYSGFWQCFPRKSLHRQFGLFFSLLIFVSLNATRRKWNLPQHRNYFLFQFPRSLKERSSWSPKGTVNVILYSPLEANGGRFLSLFVAFRNTATLKHGEIKHTRSATKQKFSWELLSKPD